MANKTIWMVLLSVLMSGCAVTRTWAVRDGWDKEKGNQSMQAENDACVKSWGSGTDMYYKCMFHSGYQVITTRNIDGERL